MIKDDLWPVARLIPISSASGIEAQERRAASALLAVLGSVDEYGRALLKPLLGAPAGKIETFIEIPLKVDGRSVRPDGIITVSRGSKSWGCIVEVKTQDAQLEAEQVETYLDLARELDVDAVLTISNQFKTSSSEYPIPIDKRKIKKAKLYHWSWSEIVTEAIVQKQYRGVKDPDQAYILSELIRYLTDPRSGALSFDDMGPGWVKVRDGARERTLRRGDAEADDVIHRWDALVRYLCLHLTKDLGRDVQQMLSTEERGSPAARQNALKDGLIGRGELHAELRLPEAAGSLKLTANLATRQVMASTTVEAPKTGTSKGRVSWLLRQLQDAPPNVKVEARVSRSSTTLTATLGMLRDDPRAIYPDNGREIRQFILSINREMGHKRQAGRGSFINSVIDTTEDFYRAVVEKLSAWKAKPPKLIQHLQGLPPSEIVVELPPKLEEAVEDAVLEMDGFAGESEIGTGPNGFSTSSGGVNAGSEASADNESHGPPAGR